jgi:hypothetical protein
LPPSSARRIRGVAGKKRRPTSARAWGLSANMMIGRSGLRGQMACRLRALRPHRPHLPCVGVCFSVALCLERNKKQTASINTAAGRRRRGQNSLTPRHRACGCPALKASEKIRRRNAGAKKQRMKQIQAGGNQTSTQSPPACAFRVLGPRVTVPGHPGRHSPVVCGRSLVFHQRSQVPSLLSD